MKRFGLALCAAIVMVAVVVDQIVKWLVETRLEMHEPVSLLPFLALYRTYNTGVAFSMFSWAGDTVLAALAVAIIAFVLVLAWRSEPHQTLTRAGFALVVGGAIGNLIDRTWHGYVIDYILFHTQTWSFAVFNLADVFISVGAGLVVLDEILAWRRQRRA